MEKRCKRYITIAGIVIIYALYMPVAFVSQAKNMQVQNEATIPMRTIYLNNTMLSDFDNNELNNRDRFICLYSYIQQVIDEKIKSYTLNTTKISLYKTIIYEEYDKTTLGKELTNNKVQMISYFKSNKSIKLDWTYVNYKIILNQMNNKYI